MSVISAKDRVLIYLLGQPLLRNEFDAPFYRTQEGISKGIRAKQNTVSYAWAALERDRCVDWRMAHVRGLKQRRKSYTLTEAEEGLRVWRARAFLQIAEAAHLKGDVAMGNVLELRR